MVLAYVIVFVAAYTAALARATRRGRGALLATAAAALAVILTGALLLGLSHAVPSIARLMLVTLLFMAPAVLLPPVLLWRRATVREPAMGLALAGAAVGLLMGWVLVVFGVRVW